MRQHHQFGAHPTFLQLADRSRNTPQFDAQCLEFVLDFFGSARDDFYGPAEGPRRDLSESTPPAQANMQNPLFLKQAIIVLREELEYFAIPPTGAIKDGLPVLEGEKGGEVAGTDAEGKPNQALLKLKVDCGNALLGRKSIFTALQRNVNRENNVAEQHLIDMLCMRWVLGPLSLLWLSFTDPLLTHSGFEREDIWGYRSLEPNRCCIASIALVLLKTGIVHPPITVPEGAPKPAVEVNAQQLATAQKLLLFWRKPAVSGARDGGRADDADLLPWLHSASAGGTLPSSLWTREPPPLATSRFGLAECGPWSSV